MQRLILVLAVLAASLAGRVGTCADIEVPDKLSLADAIQLALKANVGLKSAAQGYDTSVLRLKVAELDTTYSLSGNATLDDSPYTSEFSNRLVGSLEYKGMSGTEASLDLSPFGWGSERGSVGLTIRQPLVKNKGMLSPKADLVQTARSQQSIQSKQLYRSKQSTILSVVRAYLRAVDAREQVAVSERALKLAEDELEYSRKREQAGFARGIDVARAEVQVAQRRERLNVQSASARGAVDELMLAIGAGIGKIPELTSSVPEVTEDIPSLDEAIRIALANRPELSIYDERLATQQRALAMAEDELKPDVNAVARFRSSEPKEGVISGSIFDLGTSTIGVEVQLPLDKRALKVEREITAKELEILKEQRAFQMEEIAEQIRNAYRSLESNRVSLDILTQNLEQAKEELRIANRMVEEDEGDNRDVLSAQEHLTSVEGGLISAKTDLYLAVMELKYAMGEDLTEMVLK